MNKIKTLLTILGAYVAFAIIFHGYFSISIGDITSKIREIISSGAIQETTEKLKPFAEDIKNIELPQFNSEHQQISSPALLSSQNDEVTPNDFGFLTKVSLIRVVDGDTLVVYGEDGEYYVRLIGIDTPESVNPDQSKNNDYGVIASTYTKTLLNGTDTLYLQFDKEITDRYGRTLAYVWLKEDVDPENIEDVKNYMLNGILIRDGLAINKEYPPNTAFAYYFNIIKNEAQSFKTGLWSDENISALWQ